MARQRGTRLGAAAFALGLSLAGPQALGVASADSGDADSAVATAKAAATRSGRTAGNAAEAPPASRIAVPRSAAATGEPGPAAGDSVIATKVETNRRSARVAATTVMPPRTTAPVQPAPVAATAAEASTPTPAISTPRRAAAAAVGLSGPAVPSAAGNAAVVPAAAVVSVPILQQAVSGVNEAVVGFFDALSGLLSGLPASPVSELLSGALLLVRRNLFDQAPTAAPVQITPYRSHGEIQGVLGAVDAEGDPLTYEVIDTPEFGTVVVDAQGRYTYTPGPDFAGSLTPDTFTVRISDANGGFNLFDPFGGHAIDVVVNAPDPTTPFFEGNTDDLTVLLENTPARLDVVTRNGNLFGTVSLAVPDATTLHWMDEKGRTGTVSVAEVESDWDKITDAGAVQLGISFVARDGARYTVILDSVQASLSGTGAHVFSGQLADLAADGAVNNAGEADIDCDYDVLGGSYGAQYEAFRASIAGDQTFGQDLTGADVFLDTWSVQDWKDELAGADLGDVSGVGAGASANATAAAVAANWSLDVQTLKDALAYSKACGQISNDCLTQNFNQGFVYTDDPIFGAIDNFVPACGPALSCTGTFYLADASSAGKLSSLANTSLALGSANQSLDVSLDLGGTAYGYIYVPDGIIDKLRASQYAAGMFLSITTGPSVTLNLGDGNGTFTLASQDLVNLTPLYSVTPYGTIQVNTKVTASLDATLELPAEFTGNQLKGSIYATGGMVVGYNTGGSEGFQWGGSAFYVDTDFSDFAQVTGITLSPTITPSITGSWGLFTPANTPVVGQISFLDVSLGYSNPLSANLTWSSVNDPSITFSSSGSLDFSAGLVPSITSALTYSTSFELYNYTSGNVLA